MTSPGGDVVGRQYVEIWPSLRRWASEMRAGMSQANAETRRQLQPIERQVEEHNRHIIGSTVGMVARAGKTIITAGGAAATAATAIGLKAAASTEVATTAFTQLLGGVRQSQKYMGDLAKFAAATPFEMPGLINASRQLLGAGASAKSVIPTLTAWGNAAGSLGIQQEDFNGILLAVSQSMNKQKVQNEELMQITERGIPVYPLLAKAMGKPVATIQQMASDGKLLAKDTLPLLEKQMNKDYGGGLIKQSQTLLGLWSTFKDTFTQGMSAAITPALPMIKSVLLGATNDMTSFFTGIQGKADKVHGSFNTAGLGIRSFFLALREGDVTSKGFIGKMETAGASIHGFVVGVQGTSQPMDGMVGKLNTAGLGVKALISAYKEGDVTSDGFIGAMERIGATTRRVFDYVKDTAIPTTREWISEFRSGDTDMAQSKTALVSIGESFKELAPAIREARQELPSLSDALTIGASVLHFMAQHVDTVVKLMPLLVGGLIAYRVAQLAANVAQVFSIPTKIAEIVVNRQLVKSNRELIASRQGVTAAAAADTTARSTNILSGILDRFRGSARGAASESASATKQITPFGGALQRLNGPASSAVGSIGRAGTALRGMGSAVLGTIAGLGPLGVALGIAAAVVGVFAGKKKEAQQKVEDFTRSVQADSGAVGENTRALVSSRLEQAGALTAASALGVSLQDVTDAALGNSDAMNRINIVTGDAHARYAEFIGTGQTMEQGLGDQEVAAQELGKAIGGTNAAVSAAVESANRQTAATGPATDAITRQGAAAVTTGAQVRGYTSDLFNATNQNADAESSAITFRTQLASLSGQIKANGTSLSINTAQGRTNRQSIIDLIGAAQRHADAVGRQTGKEDLARKAFQQSIPQIKEQAAKLGLNKAEVDKLVNSIAKLKPKTVPVTAAVTVVDTLSGGRVSVDLGGGRRAIRQTGLAAGGWVGGSSPHGTADDQMIGATSDEFMVKRPSAQKLRRDAPGLLEFLNNYNRHSARGVDIAGDAGMLRVGSHLNFAGGGSIPAVQSFLRGTDPLPYIWGGGGPGGYDCSGLVGAAYGKLTGRGGGSGQRYFTTDSIGSSQGFRPGLGTFSVGVTPGRGHMAGNLAGLKFEARSTASGIHIGASAMPVTSFARKFFLPQVGGVFNSNPYIPLNRAQKSQVVRQIAPLLSSAITKTISNRDSGGPLYPGQLAYNESGGRERVLNQAETREWEGRGGITPDSIRNALSGMMFVLHGDVVELVNKSNARVARKGGVA